MTSKQHFGKLRERIDAIKKNVLVENNIVDIITKRGVDIARQEYTGTSVTVSRSVSKNGSGTIYSEAPGLFYMEYGTGRIGAFSHPADMKLPQKTFKFESPKGVSQVTQGWEYYYNNPATKVDGGWYYGKDYAQFTKGQPAGAQMYNTAKKLRTELAKILKNKVKGE